ncbi:Ger(x)C family spore germination protein [Paenibacillus sp. H1-7]|uniref:Ger(x)C family spore germination protein n=1 Tax=Paenibacillus sp. H1-7 TaxID=2282849 RepID=UPI001EF83807|nr:Ger(x)C family spore germination protein [Paenibacillus sp. H1-7]
MKRFLPILLGLIAAAMLLVSGCGDRRDLEDLTVILMTGIDLDEKGNLLIYESSPVFSREAKDKEEEYGIKALTLRQARVKMDAVVSALSVGGKTQLVLLSKKLLEQKDWFRLFDSSFRDAKNSINARVVAVDGPVAEVIKFYPRDKPRLPLHLVKLIDTSARRNLTVKTTMQELQRQMTDKGLTPYITEIRKEKEIKLNGTALLNEQGNYVTRLEPQENMLLRMLQGQGKGEMPMTVSIPDIQSTGPIKLNELSFAVRKVSTKVKTGWQEDRFSFQLAVNLSVVLTEKVIPPGEKLDEQELERIIQEQMQYQLTAFVHKIQKLRIDPFGLGNYARAYQYDHWSKIKERWGEAFAESRVNIALKVRIKDLGPIK